MTRKFGKHPHATYGTLNSCFNLIVIYKRVVARKIRLTRRFSLFRLLNK